MVSVGLHLPQLRNASMGYELSTQCSELLKEEKSQNKQTNKTPKPTSSVAERHQVEIKPVGLKEHTHSSG